MKWMRRWTRRRTVVRNGSGCRALQCSCRLTKIQPANRWGGATGQFQTGPFCWRRPRRLAELTSLIWNAGFACRKDTSGVSTAAVMREYESCKKKPTMMLALDAHRHHPQPFTEEELRRYREPSPGSRQPKEVIHRRKVMVSRVPPRSAGRQPKNSKSGTPRHPPLEAGD